MLAPAEPALELRPRIALSSAQVEMSLADPRSRRQHRTFHLLIKPDVLTCYQQALKRSTAFWVDPSQHFYAFRPCNRLSAQDAPVT